MAKYRILFVDDDPLVLKALGDYFGRVGHDVFRAGTSEEGMALYRRVKPDVTVLDLIMPGMSGLQMLENIRRAEPNAMVIMLTGVGEVEPAVEAMRLGAENFLSKPVDMPHLLEAVGKAAEKAALRQENVELKRLLRPNVKRLVVRWAGVIGLIAASVGLGRWIGGSADDARPRAPIPVPIIGDTAGRP